MTIYEKIIEAYPELKGTEIFSNGIILQDDSDGQGAYIVEWTYTKPIPAGLKLGK